MKLALPAPLTARIADEARRAYPFECCGLIEGTRAGEDAIGMALHSVRNLAARKDRFEIDPRDHFAALKAARDNGHALIGCYHSHPDGQALPSAADLQGAGEDRFLWLIAALGGAQGPVTLKAFAYSSRLANFASATLLGSVCEDLVTSSEKSRT